MIQSGLVSTSFESWRCADAGANLVKASILHALALALLSILIYHWQLAQRAASAPVLMDARSCRLDTLQLSIRFLVISLFAVCTSPTTVLALVLKMRLLNCALYVAKLLVANASFDIMPSAVAGLAAAMFSRLVLVTGICVLLNTFKTASCLTSSDGSAALAFAGIGLKLVVWMLMWFPSLVALKPSFGMLRFVAQGIVQTLDWFVTSEWPKSVNRALIVLASICDIVAVLSCLNWRLFDITNETLLLPQSPARSFVSFSDMLAFSAESQAAIFFPNATRPALISFVISDAISV